MSAKYLLLPFFWLLSISCGDTGIQKKKLIKISSNLVDDTPQPDTLDGTANPTSDEQDNSTSSENVEQETSNLPNENEEETDNLVAKPQFPSEEDAFNLANSIDSISAISLGAGIEEGNIPLCAMEDTMDANGFCPKSEQFESGGVGFVCSKQKYSLTKTPNQLVAINPYADTLWPGSLIQSKPLMEGILNPVPLDGRSTGSITMAIATDTAGVFSKEIAEPSLASTTEAIKEILSTNVNIDTPAKFYYKLTQVHSNKQLAVAIGLHVDTPFNFDIQTSLEFNSKEVKNRILIDFTQEYYTIAYTPKHGIKGFFKDSVNPNQLDAFMGEGNPLAYISSVTYGRKIYLLFESEASMSDLEGAIKASFQAYGGVTVGGDLAVKNKKVMSESQVKAYVIGGNAEDALEALNTPDEETGGTIVNLKQLMSDGANFSKGNPGVPVSYTVRHVKDASQIKLVLNTDYEARECAPVGSVNNPMTWTLKVSLEEVAIDRENGFCDFGNEGEFSSCLKVAIGDNPETPIFCNNETRKAKPGQVLTYGQSNHSALIEVKQSPGQVVKVLGNVREHDGNNFEEVVNFAKDFTLNQNYEWTDWSEVNQVIGVKRGCKANLKYKLEWIDRYLSSN